MKDSIFFTAAPSFKGVTAIQKCYASDTVLADTNKSDQYVLIKKSERSKILCKLVRQPVSYSAFAICDASVVVNIGLSERPISPLDMSLDVIVGQEFVEPIPVATAKRMVVSVIFSDVRYQSVWSKNLTGLAVAVKHLLRLFVVHNDCVVSMHRLGPQRDFNVDFLLVHKTDCKNNMAVRIGPNTTVMIVKAISSLQFYHEELGLEIKPLFSMEPHVNCLTNIIKAARNGRSPICNMILVIGPPGTGKSSLVYHIASSLKCIFFKVMSPDFINAEVGSTELMIRDLFRKAQLLTEQNNKTVCVILFEKAENMLNCKSGNANRISAQIQDCLASVQNCSRVLIIATTSVPHLIDATFKQGSRFSFEIHIGVPSESDRFKLIEGISGNLNLNVHRDIALSMAKLTPGYTADDLELVLKEICNELQLTSNLENSALNSIYAIIAKHPASSLKSGIGQVITKSDSGSITNLGGLTKVKLMFDICIKWPLMHPKTFKHFSVPPPKGVLLYGPPGCGKTSLVRSLALSANLNVLTAMAAELYSPYLGVTEANISQLFQQARANIPAVLFIDEIDSLVNCRSEEKKSSSGFDDRVLSTFLVEMDGITNDTEYGQGVVVVAATNRPDKIDAALLRPGRFDRQIYVPPPVTTEERFDILHTIVNNPKQRMPLLDSSILNEVASKTDYFSAADLANVVKEAGLSCLTMDGLETSTVVKSEHFEDALKNVKPSLTEKQISWYSNFSSRQKK